MEQSIRMYDVHCTVDKQDAAKVEAFRASCAAKGIKTVAYENGVPSRGIHVMTSNAFDSSDKAHLNLAIINGIANELRIPVLRRKIEVSPRPTDIVTAANYFEVHVSVILPMNDDGIPVMNFDKGTWSISRNVSKDKGQYALTMRCRNVTYKKFKDAVKKEVAKLGGIVDASKEYRIERCIFDDNVEIDRGWMGKNA